MPPLRKIFDIPPIKLKNGSHLHIVNIESISPTMGDLINKKIRLITEGNTKTDISLVKKRLLDFLLRKKGTTIEMGAVAEFLIHLYLSEQGFKQECLYFNLEERSIKKGFDAYYSMGGIEWVLESKSGMSTTVNISHPSKINEAYSDLVIKIADKDGNNPWRNAYNHACHLDVSAAEDIIKNLKRLSNDFDSKTYQDIANLNIIPASTIFLCGSWVPFESKWIESEIRKVIKGKKYKNINIICVTKKSMDLLVDFLKK